jgi:hypothetical protein
MDGRARVLEPGSTPDDAVGALRAKYPQYREYRSTGRDRDRADPDHRLDAVGVNYHSNEQ